MLTRQEIKSKERGITLVVLVITIIVLLILAGVSISSILGESGLINQALNAKEKAKINEEKEIIELCAISSVQKSTNFEITKNVLQEELNRQKDEKKIKVIDSDNIIYVYFEKSDRYYTVNDEAKVELAVGVSTQKDINPGDITTDETGKKLAGTEEEPYQINCIEDLCGFSNSVNSGTSYSGKYIVLMRDLDFNSYFSYVDGSISISGNIATCKDIEELRDLLTNREKSGFIPIGCSSSPVQANFNGQNHSIKNIYENTDQIAGLFGVVEGNSSGNPTTIKNLTITGEITSLTSHAGGVGGYMLQNYSRLEKINNYANALSYGGSAGGLVRIFEYKYYS